MRTVKHTMILKHESDLQELTYVSVKWSEWTQEQIWGELISNFLRYSEEWGIKFFETETKEVVE